jgi:hypothetical protein
LWESGEIISVDKLNLKSLYIGSSPPQNPVDGMVWVDTSSTPFLVKVYRGGVWDIARGASTDKVTAPPASASDYQTPTAASASSELSHEYAAGSVGQGVNHLTWFAHLKAAFYAYGRVWVVYSPSVGLGTLYVASSADLSSWVVTSIDSVYNNDLWDSWFDGTYLHLCYVWYDNSSTYYLCYRRCTPNSDGSLTLNPRYQIWGYTSYSFARPPRICVDDQGYAWIVVRAEAGFSYGAGVYYFKNARNDGSWQTANDPNTSYLWLATNAPYAAIGTVGSGGRMLAVCGNYDQTPHKLKARFFNGSSWETSVDVANLYSADYWFTTPILGPDSLVHLLFREYSTGNVHHITFNPASKTWSTPTNLGFTGQYGFSLFRDHRGILAAYISGLNTLNIMRYADGVWLQPTQYTLSGSTYQHRNLHQASPGEKAALLWVYASSSPYPLLAA